MIYVNARFLTQPITGVQRFAIELSIRLKDELGDNIAFLCPKNILHHDLAKHLKVNVIGNKTGHLWEQIDLPQYLKKSNNNILLNLCNTAPLLYHNNIVTIHDVAFEVFPKTYNKKFLLFYKFLIPRIIRKAKKIITVSEFSKQEIIKFYNIESTKIHVIHNAVSDIFKDKNEKKPKTENKYFLAVSSLNYRKNLTLVLESFLHFSKLNNNYKLVIVGGVDKKSFSNMNLESYYNHPMISFTGRVSDQELVDYYTNATAFLYPSFYEGFGIPPLEAQSCGCPCILSSSSCFFEIFEDSVLYCDPNNVKSLVNCMENLTDEKIRDQLITKGRQNVCNYNWDNSVRKLLNLLNNV